MPPQDFPLEGEVPHSQASGPGRRQPNPTGRAPSPRSGGPRFTEGTPRPGRVLVPCRPGCTARSRLQASDGPSPALAPGLGEVRRGQPGLRDALPRGPAQRKGARTAPGSAGPAPARPLGRGLALPSGFPSAGANRPPRPSRPVPSRSIRKHALSRQECANGSQMWTPTLNPFSSNPPKGLQHEPSQQQGAPPGEGAAWGRGGGGEGRGRGRGGGELSLSYPQPGTGSPGA